MFALCYGIANNIKIGKYTYKKKYHECWTLIAQMGIDKPVCHWYPDRIENESNKWNATYRHLRDNTLQTLLTAVKVSIN